MDEQRPDPAALLKEVSEEEKQKTRGKLKIFFGYSAGVGKTYAMLEEAHLLKKTGIDVVMGYIEPHQRPQTLALFKGLPAIPPVKIEYKEIVLNEFDIDSAIARKPKLILVDELAHTNANGCRHTKRFQDVEELLRAGINVYTTVNVQHIESLNDVVESITGIAVRERIPDHIFNSADKVELVDIEPEDLIQRLNSGKIYKEEQAKNALNNFFTKENLVALREIALRKTADRVNINAKKSKAVSGVNTYVAGEHVLMCLSSSPSNAKVVRTAAKMAEAFHSAFTALFVETTDFEDISDEDKARLRDNLRLSEQLGAKIATVYGDDVAYQVSEYAKASSVSKIVLGRPVSRKIFGFGRQNYVDKLTAFAPDLEIYVIPNKLSSKTANKKKHRIKAPIVSFSDTLKSLLCLIGATAIGFWFYSLGFSESNIITVYILATLFTAVVTEGKAYSLISSILAVLMFNFFFTEPRFSFSASNLGYPITFLVMFLSAFITSTFTKRVKSQAKQASLKAHRTEILLETTQKLQQAKDRDGIFYQSVHQIKKLLERVTILYPAVDGVLGKPMTFNQPLDVVEKYLTVDEGAVAQWVFKNNKHAGATTNTLSGAKCLYLAVRSNDTVFAVVGVAMTGEKVDAFEKSLLIAMLAECALALEKESILEAKNEITLHVNKEQLRSNLLRAISHDLRTPLTGIAGGSEFLLESLETLDNDTIRLMLTDISNDALWLNNLVENLLNMTRIQDGKLTISKTIQVVDEVLSVAISKVMKRSGKHKLEIKKSEETVLAPMDAQLIIQVIINLLDNAFRHTREDSKIYITYGATVDRFTLTISDDGGGIPKERIDKVFEPFFTMTQTSTDKQRGMGLGLSICKSIVEAHSGVITAENNEDGGATFKIILPIGQ